MRILLLSTAAIALSGCSWLGLGGHHGSTHAQNNSYGAYKTSQQPRQHNTNHLARWNVEGGFGREFMAGGNLLSGADNSLRITTPAKLSMKSAYETGKRFDLGGSYAVNPNRKLIVNGFQSKFDGERQIIGTQGATTLSGQISDYDSYGIEAGMRQYFLPMNAPLVRSVRPYVEGRLGATHVDDINIGQITRTSPGGVVTNRGSYRAYDGGWVPNAAGLVGVETPLFNRMTVGVETGIRYSGKLDAVPGGFAGENGGEKWSVPLSLRGRYRF